MGLISAFAGARPSSARQWEEDPGGGGFPPLLLGGKREEVISRVSPFLPCVGGGGGRRKYEANGERQRASNPI